MPSAVFCCSPHVRLMLSSYSCVVINCHFFARLRARLTLITCGGEFDYTTGEYKERTIVRAVRLPDAA